MKFVRFTAMLIAAVAVIAGWQRSATAQAYPPGTFSWGGFPIVCGPNVFVMNAGLPDAGFNNGAGVITLNPMVLNRVPLQVAFYIIGHECGHTAVGADEVAADCWSVRTGRAQGWFPPTAFPNLIAFLQNNPGDMRHPPGVVRLQAMMNCYQQP